MNTNGKKPTLPLTKEQLDVIAASLMTGEARYKDSRTAAVTQHFVNALRYCDCDSRHHLFADLDLPNCRI